MKVFTVLDATQLTTLRAVIDTLDFEDGTRTAHGWTKGIKQNAQVLESNPEAGGVFRAVRHLFDKHIPLRYYAFPRAVVGLRIARYEKGGHYGWHMDHAIMAGQRSDLSFTLMLSSDFEGGELELDLGFGRTRVRPKPGQMVVYSTGVAHQVTPVVSGERLCIVGWVRSLVRDQEDRELLFKLRQQLLRQDEIDTDQAAKLERHTLFQQLVRRFAS
jgi:PKHD-type hydroxylase